MTFSGRVTMRGWVLGVAGLLLLVPGRGQAAWAMMNGGHPVDTGQPVVDWAVDSMNGMPMVRIPNAQGPDDLVYLFKVGTNTVMGRLKGQDAHWEIWSFAKDAGGAYSSELPPAWSAEADVLPVALDSGAWHDKQMRLVHDPADSGTTFFGFANARIKMGVGDTDEHSYTHGVKFDGTRLLRWTSGTDWQPHTAGQLVKNTLWGQWMGPGSWGKGVSSFDYDPQTGMGILLSQWCPTFFVEITILRG